VVHPDDPLAPGQVLDRVAEVRELPVHDGGDGVRAQVRREAEQEVVRAEVAVDERVAVSRKGIAEAGDGCRVDLAQDRAADAEDFGGAARVDELLAGDAAHEAEGQRAAAGGDHGRDRDRVGERGEQQPFAFEAGGGIGAFVAFRHRLALAEGLVRIAVRESTHPPSMRGRKPGGRAV
ncbi:hypothetical protein ADL26_05295, partial [Thermoactinomyces vulgaris]